MGKVMNHEQRREDHAGRNPRVASTKKAYRRPVLTALGSVQQITLGGSPNVGESGTGGDIYRVV